MKRNAATPTGIDKRLRDARFGTVTDPRRSASVTYELGALLSILVCAMVTGARSLRQAEQRSLQMVKKLGRFRGITRRVADNTFSALLSRLSLVELMSCLHRLVKAEHRRGNLAPTRLPVSTVAVDGKAVATLRWHDLCRVVRLEDEQERTPPDTEENIATVRERLARDYPEAQLCESEHVRPYALMRVHTATLVSSSAAVCIHQRPIVGATNEIGSMPMLLQELRGAYGRTRLFELVTTDAGNTSLAAATQIRQMGCHYFCRIKSPQGELYAEAERALERRGKAQANDTHTESQNGCVVTYYLWRYRLGPQGWLDWEHARQLVRVQRISEHPATGEREVGNRYWVLSQDCDELDAKEALKVSRAHWRCENGTHWTADVELMEDRGRLAWSRHPQGVLVISAIRMMALLILAVARQLSRLGYSKERPSWSDVIQHFMLALCSGILQTQAFDDL